MSSKVTNFVLKSSVDRSCSQTPKSTLHKSEKTLKHAPKKVLSSKKLTPICTETKSCSNGVANKKFIVKPKKTTKSDSTVTKKFQNNVVDYCKKCGDGENNGNRKTQEKISSILNSMNAKCVKNDNQVKKVTKKISKPVQQYYKNEHFYTYDESLQDSNNNKKVSLDTITEVSELQTISKDSIFRIFSDSEDDDVSYLDQSSDENIQKLKEFRQTNYFECHSAKSRIKSKVSATSLNDHKCVYRFYLNERLFPVPLNTDYNNKVRCVECQLPMDLKQDSSGDKINGTIQAKVKLGTGDEARDMLLLLPVNDSLIIEERRKENKQKDDYVYFGVVKLSPDGSSIFNKTLPENSLALKYQKGYQEHQDEGKYNYKEIKDDDIIII